MQALEQKKFPIRFWTAFEVVFIVGNCFNLIGTGKKTLQNQHGKGFFDTYIVDCVFLEAFLNRFFDHLMQRVIVHS